MMFLHKVFGVAALLVFLTHASPLDNPGKLEKRVIATTSCTQDNYYSTLHSSCYSSSFTRWCSAFLQSTVTGAPNTTTVTQTVTATGAAVNVAHAAEEMRKKRDYCTSFNVSWPRTAASSGCSCLLTQSPPPISVTGGIVTQIITVTVPRTTSTGKASTTSISSKASNSTSQVSIISVSSKASTSTSQVSTTSISSKASNSTSQVSTTSASSKAPNSTSQVSTTSISSKTSNSTSQVATISVSSKASTTASQSSTISVSSSKASTTASQSSATSVSSIAPTTTSQAPPTPTNGNCPATMTNAPTCVWPAPVQNNFFDNGLTHWTVNAQGGTVNVTQACPEPNIQDPGYDVTHCLAVQFGPSGGVVKLSQTVNPCVGREYWWGSFEGQFSPQDANASIYVDWLCESINVTSAWAASQFGGPGSNFHVSPSGAGQYGDDNGYLVAMTNPYTVEIVFTSFGATGTPTMYFWMFQPNYYPM